jgi:PAS domain S-box-containing protein
MRSTDWSQTALGPVASWPQSLRTTVSTCLNSRFPILVWWGPDMLKLYNDAYRPMLGSKHPRSMGQRGREVWPEIWHIIGPMLEGVLERGEATWSDNIMLPLERKGFREECFFTFSYGPIRDESGGIGGVFSAVTETTPQVLSERRLQTLRDLAAYAASTTDEAEAWSGMADILGANPADLAFAVLYAFEEDGKVARRRGLCGLPPGSPAAPREVTVGEGPWPIQTTADRPQDVEDVGARFGPLVGAAWPEAVERALVLPIKRSGLAQSYGALVVGLSPRREVDDRYRSFLGLVADQVGTAVASARAHREEKERAEALAQIDRAKTAFFSNVSHEFRTPLTLMLGPLEDALSTGGGRLEGEALGAVHRNAVRLLKLVNTLLDFSRVEAGRIRALYQPLDLAALTRDLASAFRSAIERGGLEFEVDCPGLPAPVYVDRDMWEKIVLNLLSNAFKFTLAGSISVRLRARAGEVELEVSDTGVGIPEHELGRVFERFHRIEDARARTHEGSGIGLALVHDLVRLHGGTIRVSSRAGAGTTFRVTVPLGCAHLPADHIGTAQPGATQAAGAQPYVVEALRWLPDAGDAAFAAGAKDPPSAAPGGQEAARILVADDNADMRDYVARLLRRHWSVETVADGAQALAVVREAAPDLVLTDVMMPNLDGFGLLRALREEPTTAGIPVVMLSARAGEESRVDGLRAGADEYLVKPFSARELVARVGSQLALVRLRREKERERSELLARAEVARREAELQKEHLRGLFTQAPTPMLILRGPAHVIELANQSVCEVWGRRYEDVIGRPLLEVLPELEGQSFKGLLDGVLATGVPCIGKESLVRVDRRGDGTLDDIYFNFVYSPRRGVDGTIEGVLVLAFDVTDEVVAREQMSRLRVEADAANRTKDAFLAMLGHELRNPLAPILTALQLTRLRGGVTREFAIIERQVGLLVRLVDDLLDVSRITRGKIELRKQRLETIRVVQAGLEMAGPLLEQRRQHLELQIPGEGLPIEGDPDRLAQVVSNILTNAAKYSEPGSTVHVSASREGRQVRLRVRDHGVGIAPEMLGHIFDLFVQQPQSIDRAKGGLGLGLAIVKSLVELHGGSVRAVSEGPGHGSEFIVDLPLASPLSEGRETGLGRGLSSGRHPAPSRNRVLVVDDNVDAGQSLAEILRELGFEVQLAHDGPAALEVVAGFRPDICLLDLGLPVMDGYELARRLRASGDLPEGARIIAITGYGLDADRRRSAEAGFTAHLTKPVNLDALTQTVLH